MKLTREDKLGSCLKHAEAEIGLNAECHSCPHDCIDGTGCSFCSTPLSGACSVSRTNARSRTRQIHRTNDRIHNCFLYTAEPVSACWKQGSFCRTVEHDNLARLGLSQFLYKLVQLSLAHKLPFTFCYFQNLQQISADAVWLPMNNGVTKTRLTVTMAALYATQMPSLPLLSTNCGVATIPPSRPPTNFMWEVQLFGSLATKIRAAVIGTPRSGP